MNPNSIKTYYEKVYPELKAKHHRVYEAIRQLGPSTVYEIADHLNTAVHNISGRLTELSGVKEYGRPIIQADGTRKNKYGNPCTVWKMSVRKLEQLNQSKMF